MYGRFKSQTELAKFLERAAEAHAAEVAEANIEAENAKAEREKAREERKGSPAFESKTSLSKRKNGKIVYDNGKEEILFYDDGIKEIGKWQFGTNVAEITFPTSVTSIGFSAFDDCKNLTKLEIPESVTYIGAFAFSCCEKLTELKVPASVTEIGDSAFSNCTSLETVVILGDTKLCNNAFDYTLKLKNVHMPNVSEIGSSVFQYSAELETVVLPQNLKKLGLSNFRHCPKLKCVTIPAEVKIIADNCFQYCPEFKSVNVSVAEGTQKIEKGDFCWCPAMAWKPPVEGRTKMGKRSFPKIETVSLLLPASGTEIGEGALEYITNLKHVYYGGTKEEWAKVKIGKNNPKLTALFGKATIHYME